MNGDLFGYCGLDCSKCPVYIATQNNDDNLRRKTANDWSVTYKDLLEKDLQPEDMICYGCKTKDKNIFLGCQICKIRNCCSEKELESCKGCDQFTDCEIIQGFLSFIEIAP